MIPPETHRLRRLPGWLLLFCVCLGIGCARAPGTVSSRVEVPSEGGIALYLARFEAAEESRRFRLRLWMAPPDRVHAEVLSPVGQTVLILDGGNGKLSVMDFSEKIAFSGGLEASRFAFQRWLGTDWTTEELVTAVLGTDSPAADWSIERVGKDGRFPRTLLIRGRGVTLSLELKRWRPAPAEDSLGRAEIPPGYEVRPLADWQGNG